MTSTRRAPAWPALLIACISMLLAASPSVAAKARGGKVSDPAAVVEQRVANLNHILAQARNRLRGLAHLPSVLSRNVSGCNADMAALPPMSRYGSSGAADLQGNLFCLG